MGNKISRSEANSKIFMPYGCMSFQKNGSLKLYLRFFLSKKDLSVYLYVWLTRSLIRQVRWQTVLQPCRPMRTLPAKAGLWCLQGPLSGLIPPLFSVCHEDEFFFCQPGLRLTELSPFSRALSALWNFKHKAVLCLLYWINTEVM